MAKSKHLTIRHVSNDRVVAIVEIVSPGNKASAHPLETFVKKAVELIRAGVHLLVLDAYPPGPRDPDGLHTLIWDKIDSGQFQFPTGTDRLLAAYQARFEIRAYLNTLGVGDHLLEMPLFLGAGYYIPVDLEVANMRAYEFVPRQYQRILEGFST